MFMSEEQEIALGTQYDPSVVSTFGIYDHPQLLNLITEKGTEMGKISHRPHLEYHFKILDTPVINAFAVPGGYIYLTRGILTQFNNEAELMGVLGHEMGHITARHTAQQQTNQQIGQVLLAGGMLASKQIYELAEVAMQGMQLLFLSFSRDNEREADRLGVEYSTKIGYDSREMANFFDVLNKMQMESSHAGVPTFMSTHPDPGDRYNSVNKTSEEWQTKLNLGSYAVNKNSYLGMIDGMVYGEDPRQGFVENNVFYHPDLKFKYPFPKDWTLVNSPLQVQITPPEKNAVMVFSLSKEKTVDAASQKILDELKLTLLKSKKTKVNGYNAFAVISQQVSQDQQVIKLLSYFIEKDGLIYIFHGVSSGADFDNYLPAFESTMTNFARLTDKTKLNVKPDRIKVIKINSTTVSLESAFNYYKVPQDKYDEMALLNNMELNHTLRRGDLIKVLGK
jgi:predicted Zn-dependent protease